MDKRRQIIHQGGVPIGYITGRAAIIDADFFGCAAGRELTRIGVQITWQSEVANILKAADENKQAGKRIMVYQLMAATAPEKKFVSYEQLCELYGGPDRTDYHLVFDGRVAFESLDELYELLSVGELPKGFTGRRLSMSDIIELCDDEDPALYYVDAEDYILTNWKE